MELEEIKKKKEILNKSIADSLTRFQEETGCAIDNVMVEKISISDCEVKYTYLVDAKLDL